MVGILIVDSYPLMRWAVRDVVEKEADLLVIAEAENGDEAKAQAAELQPDVVLMDADMPDGDGFAVTEHILACSPNSRIIIFTAHPREQHVFQAIFRGAIGYLAKDTEPEALIHAIRCAARNDFYIPGAFSGLILAQLRAIWLQMPVSYPYHLRRKSHIFAEPTLDPSAPKEAHKDHPLTEREEQVMNLVRQGWKNRDIAKKLGIAESTVHKHLQNIFDKLHVHNRAEAIYLTSLDRTNDP